MNVKQLFCLQANQWQPIQFPLANTESYSTFKIHEITEEGIPVREFAIGDSEPIVLSHEKNILAISSGIFSKLQPNADPMNLVGMLKLHCGDLLNRYWDCNHWVLNYDLGIIPHKTSPTLMRKDGGAEIYHDGEYWCLTKPFADHYYPTETFEQALALANTLCKSQPT